MIKIQQPNRYEEGAYGVVFFDEYDCAVSLTSHLMCNAQTD